MRVGVSEPSGAGDFPLHPKGPGATQLPRGTAIETGPQPPHPSELSRKVRNLNYLVTSLIFLKCGQPIKSIKKTPKLWEPKKTHL